MATQLSGTPTPSVELPSRLPPAIEMPRFQRFDRYALGATLAASTACTSAAPPATNPAKPTPTVSAPAPTVEPEAPVETVDADAPTAAATRVTCRCGILDFEDDGPPKGSCTWQVGDEGVVTLTSTAGSPAFSAKLTPIRDRRADQRVYYAFEGEFDFSCAHPWCGKQKLSVLSVADGDYRVTVARSDDGPPSHVLWLTCAR